MAIQGLISDLFKEISRFLYKDMIQGLIETYLDSVVIQKNILQERPHIGIFALAILHFVQDLFGVFVGDILLIQ